MAEITSAGYQFIRNLVKDSTVYLALFNASDVQIGSRALISDGSWSENGQTLTITKVYAGTDFTLPQTVKSSCVYNVATNGNALTALEVFTEGTATLRANADTLTVLHKIEIPQIT